VGRKKRAACFAFHIFPSDFSGTVVGEEIPDNMLCLITSGLYSILLFLFRMSKVISAAALIKFFLKSIFGVRVCLFFLVFKIIRNLICLLKGALINGVALQYFIY